MGARRAWDDSAMKALLRGYSRSAEDRAKFEALFDAATGGAKVVPLRRNAGLPVLGWASAAAVFLALIVCGGIFLRGALWLDSPLEAYSVAPDGSATALAASRPGRLGAPEEGELRLSSPGEIIAAAAGSGLSVGMDPWRGFTRDRGFAYRIDSGAMYLFHDAPASPFRLDTPFGSIRPLGTALSLRLDARSLDLACLEGRIAFKAKGADSEIEIATGHRLRIDAANETPALRKMRDGETLPFAPAYPDIRQLPVNAPTHWKEAESADGAERGPGEPATAPPPRAASADLAAPSLKKTWSTPSGAAAPLGARLEASADGLFILSGEVLAGYDPKTGEPLFRVELGAEADGFAAGKDAYLLSGSQLSCRDGRSGAEKWKAKAGPISFGGIVASGGRVFISSADGNLYAFDAASGSSVMKAGAGIGMYGVPALVDGRIIASALDGSLRGFALDGGSPAWAYPTGERLSGDRPFSMEGGLVVDALPSGAFVALDAKSGTLRWKAATAGKLAGPPIALGAQAVFEDGSGIRLLSAAGKAGSPLDIPRGDLLAARARPDGAEIATRGGIWRIDRHGKPAAPLLKADIAAARIREDGWIVLEARGGLSAWETAE